jgi:plasmid maintenance system antidote protein VapI
MNFNIAAGLASLKAVAQNPAERVNQIIRFSKFYIYLFLNYYLFCVNKIVYFCSMNANLDIIKGVHPGIILERELKQRKLGKGQFALSINEFPQTLGSITKGKRKMNTSLALKIEHALHIEEGYFMILQVFYDIEEEKRKSNTEHPDLSKLRPVLFWDTKIEKINWKKQKRAVIKRIFERGNEIEKNEITRFYGKESIDEVLNN